MEKIKMVPCSLEHLEGIQPRSFEAVEMARVNYREYLQEYLRRGPGYTVFMGERILVMAGLIRLWPGVAEPWMITTKLTAVYPKAFHQTVSVVLPQLIQAMGLWRVQTAIHGDHWVSQKWVKRLGFAQEGTAPAYGPDGATYVRFVRIIPENLPHKGVD